MGSSTWGCGRSALKLVLPVDRVIEAGDLRQENLRVKVTTQQRQVGEGLRDDVSAFQAPLLHRRDLDQDLDAQPYAFVIMRWAGQRHQRPHPQPVQLPTQPSQAYTTTLMIPRSCKSSLLTLRTRCDSPGTNQGTLATAL